MASNVAAFDMALRSFAEKTIPEEAATFQRAVCLEALRGVVFMSPVDKGRFRGNWQVGLGAPVSGEVESFDKSGGATFTAGAAVISGLTRAGWVWLCNNLDYAESLEKGHSQQAPGGMVALTVARLNAWLNSR